jgi:hypothetical protein
MKKKPEMSAHGKKALYALREAVREAVADHRRAGVPIVVRTERSARRQPEAVRERSASYGTERRPRVDQ